jgi:hypothetical protein
MADDDKLAQQVHNVRSTDHLNPIEWDLPKSANESPESYSKIREGIQSQI